VITSLPCDQWIGAILRSRTMSQILLHVLVFALHIFMVFSFYY